MAFVSTSLPACYGPEFVAQAVRDWIAAVGPKTAHIEPGSPWENGYVESFNSKLRDEPSVLLVFGYARGSTDVQTLEAQLTQVEARGRRGC